MVPASQIDFRILVAWENLHHVCRQAPAGVLFLGLQATANELRCRRTGPFDLSWLTLTF